MTFSLVVLCLGAFALVCALTSALVLALSRLWRSPTQRSSPSHQARLHLLALAMPLLTGLLAVSLALLPALGLAPDHCLSHGSHHLHLCPYHLSTTPGLAIGGIVVLFCLRVSWTALQLGFAAWKGHDTASRLRDVSYTMGDLHVHPSPIAEGFVLGVFRPRVHVSSALLALPKETVDAVLAHERAHVVRRDPLLRALGIFLEAFHWPSVARMLRSRLRFAQETSADMEAAKGSALGRLRVASALVTLAAQKEQWQRHAVGLSFTQGQLEERVRALLAAPGRHLAWPLWAAVAAMFVSFAALTGSPAWVHHGLESLLGALH